MTVPETPILPQLSRMGGRPGNFLGTKTIESFGNAEEEHLGLRRGAGLIDMPWCGVLRISGADRKSFLQRMLTSDVNSLTGGGGQLSTLLTTKGKLVATFQLIMLSDSYLAVGERSQLRETAKTLEHFVIVEDVTIVDESDQWGMAHIAGPKARSTLTAASGTDPGNIPHGSFETISLSPLSSRVLAIRHFITGEEGFDLLVAVGELGVLWAALTDESQLCRPVGCRAFQSLRLEAGSPLPGADLDGDLGPLEAGLAEAISFEKGCYLGQEVIAKMHYRGKPPKRLVGLGMDGDEPAIRGDMVVSDNNEVGRITSAVFAPSLGRPIALAVVRTKAIESEASLQVLTGGTDVPAHIEETPFR